MRCDCCNAPLSDWESTLKHAKTGQFLNTCRVCLEDLGIPSKGRPDLLEKNKKETEQLYQEPIPYFKEYEDQED